MAETVSWPGGGVVVTTLPDGTVYTTDEQGRLEGVKKADLPHFLGAGYIQEQAPVVETVPAPETAEAVPAEQTPTQAVSVASSVDGEFVVPAEEQQADAAHG